jgi:hypothetical protein
MIQTAKEYYQSGLSIIPIGEKKLPIGSWKKNQTELIEPSFSSCIGIGIVCGKVSGGVECIDIDSKYDLTGNLFDNYKNLINEIDKNLLKKLVVQSTPSGGYHFVYRCETIEGNKKLANRHTTEAEKADNPKDKIRVLIETRGEGGYFMVAPSNGYKVIYGDLNQISILSALERETLFVCARTLNEVFEAATVNKTQQKTLLDNVSPFDDWNNRGDVLSFLEMEGWVVKLRNGAKNLLLRPQGTGMWSADWNEEKRIFYVFTSSSEFSQDRGYNATQVLAKLKFNDDFSECAKWLLKEGYGSFTPDNSKFDNKQRKEPEYLNKTEINLEDDNFDFLATKEDCDTFINQKIDGTFKIADSTGFEKLDEYWRFKDASLDMVLGHDNTGKSVLTWFLAVLDCYFNNKSYIVFAGENNVGMLKYKLMEFYAAKPIKKMGVLERNEAMSWVEEHFAIIRNDVAYTYKDMLSIGKKMLKKKHYHRFIIEPYNVLHKDSNNEHQYDYKAMLDMKLFITQTKMGITLNVHAASEALRKTYGKEHEDFGYSMPPNKADAEGGGKFPNKADNFMVVHRMADHPEKWMWTQIHVQKIKEMETGGKRTFKDSPFKLKLQIDGAGFEDEYGFNPIRDRRILPTQQNIPLEPTIKPNADFDRPNIQVNNGGFVPREVDESEPF